MTAQIVSVNLENFEEIVIRGSMERPVVVDFWASWCNPCKMLGPVLEKLSQEMDFVLAKVDTEAENQLAGYFQISSIPDVRIFHQGQMIDGFQGALPEQEIRLRLGKYFQTPEQMATTQAESLIETGQFETALLLIEKLLTQDPDNRHLLFLKASAWVKMGQQDDAIALLKTFQEGQDDYQQAQSLLELMSFHAILAQPEPKDPQEKAYRDTCQLAVHEQWDEALQGFLRLVQNTPHDEALPARKAMLTLFGVLGAKHELTWKYRALLNRIIFI